MAQTTLSIRIDENVKREFDAFCSEVGMNTSVAITLFAKAVLREKRIPFEISLAADPFFSETNQRRLKESLQELNEGKVVQKTMTELEEMANA